MAVTVRSVSVRPMRNRRQKRVEARVADETGPMVAVWFNQPWLARQLGEGTALLLHGKLRQPQPVLGDRARADRRAGRPGCTRSGSCRSIRRPRGSPPSGCARWRGRPTDRIRDVVEPLPGRLRAAERLAERPAALAAVALPGRAGGPRGRPPPARVRGAVPARAGARRPQARAGGAGTRARAARAPASWWTPWLDVASLRADRRPARGVRPHRPRHRDGDADAAPADGRGRQREDRRARCTRCCARSRAARRPPSWRPPRRSPSSTWPRSTGCSAATCRSGSSPARRRRAGGRSCSTGWPRASSG